MSIFRTNDPTQFDDVDGIIIDETAPPASISGVSTNVAILAGQFQRGSEDLIEVGSIGQFLELYGKSSFSGNKQLKNKKFGRLRVVRVVAAAATKASKTFNDGTGTALESWTYTTVADVAGSLNNKYVLFTTIDSLGVSTNRYAWFNVSAGGTDPALAGKTGHMVAISTGDTADAVAAALQLVLTALADLNATVLTNVVTATMANPGQVTDAASGNSGFATAMVTQGNGLDVLTFTAKHKGAYGNNIKVTVADGSIQGKKYTIIDTNADSVIAPEVYDNILITDITASTFVGSQLVDVTVISTAQEPDNVSEVALASGTDGTVADTDYEAAIAKAAVEGAGNILFLDSYNTVRNGYLKVHAAATQDKMVIVCGPETQTVAAAVADVANNRDVDGRIIYAYPYIQTVIDGALEYTPPASWYASILSQIGPHVDPAFAGNSQFLGGIVSLKKTDLTRADYIQLKDAGISAFEFDTDLGFKIKSGVVTQILSSSKVMVFRRRMADYLTNSIAQFLKNYQNAVNSKEKRNEVSAQMLEFIQRQEIAGILPKDTDVVGGKAKLVDVESLNTNASIALGFFKILYRQRIFSSMRYIVLQAEIGESVVVTEEE